MPNPNDPWYVNQKNYTKQYYQDHKEKMKQQMRDWHARNKNYTKIHAKQYLKELKQDPARMAKYKERQRNYARKYRQILKLRGHTNMQQYAKHHFIRVHCAVCNIKEKLHIHHIKYTRRIEDCVCLCMLHHKQVHLGRIKDFPYIENCIDEYVPSKLNKYFQEKLSEYLKTSITRREAYEFLAELKTKVSQKEPQNHSEYMLLWKKQLQEFPKIRARIKEILKNEPQNAPASSDVKKDAIIAHS